MLGANWIHLGGDIPVYLFCTWWCRQGTRVLPSRIGLKYIHQLTVWNIFHLDFVDAFVRVHLIHLKTIEESVYHFLLLLRNRRIVVLCIEDNTLDAREETLFRLIQKMHGVHLEIVLNAIDRVLRFRVEMELGCLECTTDVQVMGIEVVWCPAGDWLFKRQIQLSRVLRAQPTCFCSLNIFIMLEESILFIGNLFGFCR